MTVSGRGVRIYRAEKQRGPGKYREVHRTRDPDVHVHVVAEEPRVACPFREPLRLNGVAVDAAPVQGERLKRIREAAQVDALRELLDAELGPLIGSQRPRAADANKVARSIGKSPTSVDFGAVYEEFFGGHYESLTRRIGGAPRVARCATSH